MIGQIMKHINNYFITDKCVEDNFHIAEGALALPFAKDGQYVLIEGSILNDGVYLYPLSGLQDEDFHGFVTILAPPNAFVSLVGEIEAYQTASVASPYVSESFGGYSYTKATNANGNVASWQDAFRGKLNMWRKV
jgi:hypothetical protein